MSDTKKTLKILQDNPQLMPYAADLTARLTRYHEARQRLTQGGSLSDFANGAAYYGIHRTAEGWVYREWAPNAEKLALTGDFCGWSPDRWPMTRLPGGSWEVTLPENALHHLDAVKVAVTYQGKTEFRIPLYARYVTQCPDRSFVAQVWAPKKPFKWSDGRFSARKNVPPMIYEAHVGMATEEQRVGTYAEFEKNILPRIKEAGYNTLQLMAIMEHPYYGSFGYQVSNFYAASSRYGTPDELKSLINTAHKMGITVLLDVVHAHAVKNTAEGINLFDGTEHQFFHAGAEGDHPAWGTKVFNYSSDGVKHFLLSNLKFWMDEYHFDGFRFDGVTSMLYRNHGMETAFTDNKQYFSENTNVDAVTYLMLAAELTHSLRKGALCIAEDMSGMPGMALPVEDGGIGFDYRLNMGIPDYCIKLVKEYDFGQWGMDKFFGELCLRRPGEKRIAYAESHDQSLVGDQTLIFRMGGADMYAAMERGRPNLRVERAVAVSKLLRLIISTVGGEGYLCFMGNEFGHPEWVDFPREGNNWSYLYARRQWSLRDNPFLRYQDIARFDAAMVELIKQNGLEETPEVHQLKVHEADQLLVYEKQGMLFCFNFHPSLSQQDLFIPAPKTGDWQVVLDTDQEFYGGQSRIDTSTVYHTWQKDESGRDGFTLYLPAQTACVLKYISKTGRKSRKE